MLLYSRMIVTMLVSLYTVRIVLEVLGVEDYGIYNVVGGMVVMFSFLSNTMSSAVQRFFSFELGRNDHEKLARTFSMSILIFLSIAFLVLFLSETLGLWFLNNKLVIPPSRLEAANWVFQFSIFSFILTILTIPYNAMILANEDMSIFAFISIVEATLKLVLVYLLNLGDFDKLKLYSILLFSSTLIVTSIYRIVSLKKYKSAKFLFIWDKEIFRVVLSYAGWNMIGALANIMKNFGSNIVMNLFFGPVVNAARGISFQISSILNNFVSNFYVAVRPQITKAYAAGDKDYMLKLVFQSAKMSYYLVLILSLPLFLETHFLLKIWLKQVPEYVVVFTRLLIINILLDSVNNQLVAALQAVGEIRKYQLVVSTLLLLTLPIAYIFYTYKASPEAVMWVSIGVSIFSYIPQLIIVNQVVGMSIYDYSKDVIFVVFMVTCVAVLVPVLVYSNLETGVLRFFIVTFLSLTFSLMSIYFLGLSQSEKSFVKKFIKKRN